MDNASGYSSTPGYLNEFIRTINGSQDHIIITDHRGIVIYANSAAEVLTGYSANEMMGQKAGKLWGDLMPRDYYKNMWNVITIEKRDFIGEITNRNKNGQVYKALLRIIPILNDRGIVEYFVGLERLIDENAQMKEGDEYKLASGVFNPQESQASEFIREVVKQS